MACLRASFLLRVVDRGLRARSFRTTLSRVRLRPDVVLGSAAGVSLSVAVSRRGCHAATPLLRRADELERRPEAAHVSWRALLSLLGPEWLAIVAAVVSALGVAVMNIQIPLLLGQLVDVIASLLKEPSGETVFHAEMAGPVKKVMAAYVLQGLGTFAYISTLSAMGERVAARLRRCLFESVIRQDMEFYDRTRSGELLDRLTSDVQDFKSSFKLCISQGLRSAAQTVGSVGALYLLSPALTTALVAVVPTLVGLGALFGSALRRLSRRAQSQTARATAVADEAIVNIRTVKAFAMEEQESSLFHAETRRAAELYSRLGVGIAAFQALSNLALNGIVLGVLSVGGLLMARAEMPPGDLMAFLVAAQTVQRSLAQLSLMYGAGIRGLSAGARVMEFIRLPLPSDVADDRRSSPALRPSVAFENVSFRYPTRPDEAVLRDLSLTIAEGQVVAVCGPSGAGKSTLVALLERFYEPTAGRVLIGGQDVASLDARWLRRHVLGLISQEPQLFLASVRENIRYGQPAASDAAVEAAARLANAHDFVSAFPRGYDTVVGERGSAVSGGQKQRIAIARALIKDPAVLILDEATSALDAESERSVQQALDSVMKNRTVIIIAHRLSTIKKADLIVVMAKGAVVEKGSHAELMKRRGLYWRLVEGQEFEE